MLIIFNTNGFVVCSLSFLTFAEYMYVLSANLGLSESDSMSTHAGVGSEEK